MAEVSKLFSAKITISIMLIIATLAIVFEYILLLKIDVTLLAFWVWSSKYTNLYPMALLLVLEAFTNLYLPNSVANIPVLLFLIPLLLLSLLLCHPEAKKLFDWLQLGKLHTADWILVITGSILSAAALLAWAHWSHYFGAGYIIMRQLNQYSAILIIASIMVFAFINALTEEAIYRGVIQTGLMKLFNSNWLIPIILQAQIFAAIHYKMGFPNGKVGFAMAFLYGCFLGYLRVKTKGLLASSLIHISSDCCIGLILFLAARYSLLN